MFFFLGVNSVIVREINNIQAKSVLCHPQIYDVISDDNTPTIKELNLPKNCEYIGGFVKGELIAVMVYHKFRESIKCHVQVLPAHRADHAMKFGELSLSLKTGLTVYADIPEIYPNVLKFAKSFGFKIIDKIANTGTKNGKPFNSYLLRLDKWDF